MDSGFRALPAAVVVAVLGGGLPSTAAAQDEATVNAANNPLADLIAVNLRNAYVPDASGADGSANTAFLRVVLPSSCAQVRIGGALESAEEEA